MRKILFLGMLALLPTCNEEACASYNMSACASMCKPHQVLRYEAGKCECLIPKDPQ